MIKPKILHAFLYRTNSNLIQAYAIIAKRIVSTDGSLPADVFVIKELSFQEYFDYQSKANN